MPIKANPKDLRLIVVERRVSYVIRSVIQVPRRLTNTQIQEAIDDGANLADALQSHMGPDDGDATSDEMEIVRGTRRELAAGPDVRFTQIEHELECDDLIQPA